MDEQEIFNQIRELQKQRTLLREQDTHLVVQIMELRDKLRYENIKKGYYTNNNDLFCRVYDIKYHNVYVYELDTTELCLTNVMHSQRTFKETYCKECTKEDYNNALNKIVEHYKK